MTADEEITTACRTALVRGAPTEHQRLVDAVGALADLGWEQWWPPGTRRSFPPHRLRRRDIDHANVTVMHTVSTSFLRGHLREMRRREVCPRCGALRTAEPRR